MASGGDSMRRRIANRAGSAEHVDELAGAVEPYRDAPLYDWEYRRRRHDVAFYRMLAAERGGPVLDLGCGTGRLTAPLVRDGHRVVGVDWSEAMLGRARDRVGRFAASHRRRALLARADLRALPIRGKFGLAIAAFHTVQHLVDDAALIAFFTAVRRLLASDGWFAFDVFSPDPRWLSRPADQWYDRVVFRHPVTKKRMAYSASHHMDVKRRALHMRFAYQPLDGDGHRVGRRQTVKLCHRQLNPDEVERLLRRAGLRVLARWGGFADEPLQWPPPPSVAADGAIHHTEQHVYLAGPRPVRTG
jgi:SAM-dependent methyltransferase